MMGRALHPVLLAEAEQGFSGVVFSDPGCPGLGDAFTSFDGSSDYVRGSVTAISPAAVADLAGPSSAAMLQDPVEQFLRRHELPGELIVGVDAIVGSDSPDEVHVVIGDASNSSTLVVSLPETPGGSADDERLTIRQRLASIAALWSLAAWLDPHGTQGFQQVLARCAEPVTEVETGDPSINEVDALSEDNRSAWDVVRKRLPDSARLSVGESFTFGRLARLVCSSVEYRDMVNFLYGWYDPEFKRAMGVPRERLSDENIAEPLTVELAAAGLIANAPGHTSVAIATSGWANNTWLIDPRDGHLTDFFSVAVVGREAQSPDLLTGETLRCSVSATSGDTKSQRRRQLTRELGVSAALVLLLRRFAGDDGVERRLTHHLDAFGTFEITATTPLELPPSAPSLGG